MTFTLDEQTQQRKAEPGRETKKEIQFIFWFEFLRASRITCDFKRRSRVKERQTHLIEILFRSKIKITGAISAQYTDGK